MKTKLVIVSAVLILLLALIMTPVDHRPRFIVHASGTPDSYGNKIREFRIEQYNGTDWIVMFRIINGTAYDSYIEYVPNMELRLNPEEHTRFYICVFFNQSLAPSVTIAKTFIQVNMTIPGVWSDQSLVGEDYGELQYVGDEGDFWIIESGVTTEWSDGPEADETYDCIVKYKVYR